MEPDLRDELVNLIAALSEQNFNTLVRNFLKQYYETKEVTLTNGPYDGGLDLVIYKDGTEIKRNIQVTVQKEGFEKKLFEDLEKSKINVKHMDICHHLIST